MSNPPDQGNEAETLHRFSSPSEHPGRKHVLKLVDRFSVHGPNGLHEFLVTEIAGPSLQQILDEPYTPFGTLPPPYLKRLTRELLLGLDYLRTCGVVHGG